MNTVVRDGSPSVFMDSGFRRNDEVLPRHRRADWYVPRLGPFADSFEKWLAPKVGRIITYKGQKDHGPAPAEQPAE